MAEDRKRRRRVMYRLVNVLGDGGKGEYSNLAWVQLKRWFFWQKDWYPLDNRRRKAQIDFLEAVKMCRECLRVVDEAENDNKQGLKYIRQNSQRKGVSAWYSSKLDDHEELLPDVNDEFIAERKKFEGGGLGSGRRQRDPHLGTTTMYFHPIHQALHTITREGETYDQTHKYRPTEKKQGQQQRRRQKQQNQNQQQKQND